jgi:hypothetical protein
LKLLFIHQLVLTALAAVVSLLLAHPFAAAIEIHKLLFEVGYVRLFYDSENCLCRYFDRQLVGTVVITVVQVAGVLLPGLDLAINVLLGDLGFIITQLSLTILGGLLGILL